MWLKTIRTAFSGGTRLWFMLALVFTFGALYKGEPHGGYEDLRDYFADAERLWLQFDLRISDAPEAKYSRYPLGLAILSGPGVYAGEAIEYLTGGHVGRRAVMGLIVPLAAVLASMLIYEIALMISASERVALWSGVVFSLGSPLLTYGRLFYTDVLVLFFVLLTAWAWLRYTETGLVYWLWVGGGALAGTFVCHYATILLVGGLWLAFALSVVRSSNPARWRGVAALSLALSVAVGGLLCLNAYRHGNPFRSGYDYGYAEERLPMFVLSSVPISLAALGRVFWRVPWMLPALCFVPRLFRVNRTLAWGVCLAFGMQATFWLTFPEYIRFYLRYALPLMALLALALPLIPMSAARKGGPTGSRMLLYSGLVLIMWNIGFFLSGDDVFPSFFLDPRESNPLPRCHVWYMEPLPPDSRLWGSVMGPVQYAVLSGFGLAAAVSLGLAVRSAVRTDAAGGTLQRVQADSIEAHA